MSVYVDEARHPFGRMLMCHMLADTREELLAMADSIGVERRHIQKEGTHQEHFDISKSKRALAVQHGALEVDYRGLAAVMTRKRVASAGGAR